MKKQWTWSLEDDGDTFVRNARNHLPAKQRHIPEHRILNYTAAKTSEIARVLMKFGLDVLQGNFSTYSNLGCSRK